MSQMDIRNLSFSKTTIPLGFAIRGGFEHGTSVFVSNVAAGSPADMAGLRVGDEILEANGFSLAQSTHDEAVFLIRSMNRLSLQVKNRDLLPRKDNANDPVSWYFIGNVEKKKIEAMYISLDLEKTRIILVPLLSVILCYQFQLQKLDPYQLHISDVDEERFSSHPEELDDEAENEKDADKFITIV